MNHREFTRVRSHIPVDVESSDKTASGAVGDISFEGMWFPTDMPLAEGTPCRVTIHLSEFIKIRADAVVVRSQSDGLAVKFLELLDLESYGHLRNLILYNSTDTETVEQEFEKHLFSPSTDPSLSPTE